MSREKVWVSIESEIGKGKSTLIQKTLPYLEREYGVGKIVVVHEPVHLWGNYLKKFAADPVRYAFLFQVYAFHTRQAEFNRVYAENPEAMIFISERSPLSDRFVFWAGNTELRDMDPLEVDTYPQLWETWQTLYPIPLTKMIYLELDEDLSLERIRERNRDGEVGFVDRAYQEYLTKKHIELFAKNLVPYTVLSAEPNYRDDPRIAEEYTQRIIEIINQT